MPVMRFMLVACCALLPLSAWAQTRPFGTPTPSGPFAKPPGGCPAKPAECQINAQVFDFGRGQMSSSAPPINGHNNVSVTCTRSAEADRQGRDVTVTYQLKAVPAVPARQMRDQHLAFLSYDMFVEPTRTRYWGDGYVGGTYPFEGTLFLDNRNRAGTLVHVVYGQVHGGQGATFPGQWLGLVGVQLQYTAHCTG